MDRAQLRVPEADLPGRSVPGDRCPAGHRDQQLQRSPENLENIRWNYLAIPSLQASDLTVVSAWIKEEREKNQKTFKAVLPNCPADHEGIINFTTDKITVSDGENEFKYSRAEYCARIAGILAGISLARSVTYFDLLDIIAAEVPDDPDARIDAGELILIFDGENYQIGHGVNSFVSFTTEKGEEISKIKIVEGMDLVQDNIRTTFKDYYVGKVRKAGRGIVQQSAHDQEAGHCPDRFRD